MAVHTNTDRRQDLRHCADCGSDYDALNGSCPRCPELTWAVWDAQEYDRPEQDAERGIYAGGFASKEAAHAAIPRIQASLAEAGEDVPTWQFVVAPEEA